MTVDELKVVITANTEKLKESLKGATSAMDKVKASTAKASASLKSGFTKAGAVTAKAAKKVAVGVTAGAVALGALVLKSAAATDRIDKMSQQMGMSKKGFQEWDYVLSQSGVDVDSMKTGMNTLNRQVTQSIEGTGAGAEAFKKLGVSVKDSTGKVKSQETIFNESVTALQGMKDGTEKAALAQQLFGKSGSDLMPLLNGTKESVDALKKKANDLGIVLSDSAIKAGVKFTDQLDTMKRVMGGVVSEIGVAVMPIFAKMMDWVMKNMPTIKKVFKVAFDIIGKVIKGVGDFITTVLIPAFGKFWDWIKPHIPQIKNIVKTAFDLIKGAFKIVGNYITKVVVPIYKKLAEWFFKNFPAIKNAVMKAYNYIKPSFDNLVEVIKASVMPIITGLWDTVKKAMPGIKAIFKIAFPIIVKVVKTVIDIIAKVIKVVKGIYDFIKPGLDLVATIFSKTFGGIVDIIEKAWDWLHKWNKEPAEDKNISVTTTHYNQSRGASQFAIGSRYVPYDMTAQIHKGEMIVPKNENPYANSGKGRTMPTGESSNTSNDRPLVIALEVSGSEFGRVAINSINQITKREGRLALNI